MCFETRSFRSDPASHSRGVANPAFDRTARKRSLRVPSSLRSSASGQRER